MGLGETRLEGGSAELVLAVERPEQGFEAFEQALAVALDLGIRELAQILDVPNQVRQTELNQHGALASVFAVGGIVVTAQNPLEILAQDAHQDLGAAGGIDFENHETGGPEAPDPVTLAIVLVPGLVAVEVRLLR